MSADNSTSTPIITVEDDPSPLALILATTLRRAARTPKLAATINKAKGSVALKSTVDLQAATIHFADGRAHLVKGVSPGADVVIAVDINKMGDKDAPKPKVTGAARHPKLALAAGKLLEPPHGTWQDEGAQFFAFAAADPSAPRGMRVVEVDTGAEITYGESPAEYELHGTEHALMTLFTGGSILLQDMLDGKLDAVGALRHSAALTGRSLAWMMGGA
jgi:hypothetical protein